MFNLVIGPGEHNLPEGKILSANSRSEARELQGRIVVERANAHMRARVRAPVLVLPYPENFLSQEETASTIDAALRAATKREVWVASNSDIVLLAAQHFMRNLYFRTKPGKDGFIRTPQLVKIHWAKKDGSVLDRLLASDGRLLDRIDWQFFNGTRNHLMC